LGGVLTGSPALPWAARALVFIGLMLLGSAIGAIVSYFVRLSIFSGTDRFLGFLFGLLRGAVAVGALLILAQQLRIDQQAYWRGSVLLPQVEAIASVLRSIVGDNFSRSSAPETAASGGAST
jgi:membrane protein required for colicin V production